MARPQMSLPMVIVAEGIHPIQIKLIEKMRRWEYVDLSKLLGSDKVSEEASVVIDGKIILRMEVPQRGQESSL